VPVHKASVFLSGHIAELVDVCIVQGKPQNVDIVSALASRDGRLSHINIATIQIALAGHGHLALHKLSYCTKMNVFQTVSDSVALDRATSRMQRTSTLRLSASKI